MRIAFDPQMRFDVDVIGEVKLNLDCRDEIVPILRALQHIYLHPELRDKILDLVAADVNRTSHAKRGRRGMKYWEILVLASVRLGCNFDYDRLQNLAEEHRTLRRMMGIGDWDEGTSFDWRRIRDNVARIQPETIARINHLIVAAGHQLVPDAAESVRVDSFVAGTNIHYPTEASLIRDGLGKILSIAVILASRLGATGWRQHKHLRKKVRKLVRQIDRIAARKGNNYRQRLESGYRELIALAEDLLQRAARLRAQAADAADLDVLAMASELGVFAERTAQVCGTARRRVLEGEKVPHEDKLFSIFEPHTQMYKRGKAGQPMQFGRLVLIYEDAAGFVVHTHIAPRESQDRDVIVDETRRTQELLEGRMRHASFDRGFHSPENQRELARIVAHPCLPMPGAKQAAQQEADATVEFHQARQRHPGVESAIGALQAGNGLKRCRDRSEEGFARYVQLGVLGRNLHVLGKLLIARESRGALAGQSQRKPAA